MKFSPGNYLTASQQRVLCVVLFLLLTGLAVKVWRTAHPAGNFKAGTTEQPQRP